MNLPRAICITLLTMTTVIVRADDFMDRLAESRTFSTSDDHVRAKLSGLLDPPTD